MPSAPRSPAPTPASSRGTGRRCARRARRPCRSGRRTRRDLPAVRVLDQGVDGEQVVPEGVEARRVAIVEAEASAPSATPCGWSVFSVLGSRMCATEGSGSPSMPTSHLIGSRRRGLRSGLASPGASRRSNSAQSRRDLERRAERRVPHVLVPRCRNTPWPARRGRSRRARASTGGHEPVAVIGPLCGVFRERWTPEG